MNSTKEKVSYCIGLQTGMNLKQQFSDMDLEHLNQGMSDAFKNEKPKLSTEEINSILKALRDQVQKQQREFVSKVSEENKKKAEAFLTANKAKEGVTTLSSGLQYKVIAKGTGSTH